MSDVKLLDVEHIIQFLHLLNTTGVIASIVILWIRKYTHIKDAHKYSGASKIYNGHFETMQATKIALYGSAKRNHYYGQVQCTVPLTGSISYPSTPIYNSRHSYRTKTIV